MVEKIAWVIGEQAGNSGKGKKGGRNLKKVQTKEFLSKKIFAKGNIEESKKEKLKVT